MGKCFSPDIDMRIEYISDGSGGKVVSSGDRRHCHIWILEILQYELCRQKRMPEEALCKRILSEIGLVAVPAHIASISKVKDGMRITEDGMIDLTDIIVFDQRRWFTTMRTGW